MNYFDFVSIISALDSSGFIEIGIPFLLIVLAMIFVFRASGYFNKYISIVLAVIVGMLAIFPHIQGRYHSCWNLVELINASLPKIGIFMLGFILLTIILLVFHVDLFGRFRRFFISLVALVLVFAVLSSVERSCLGAFDDYYQWIVLAALLLFGWLLFRYFRH